MPQSNLISISQIEERFQATWPKVVDSLCRTKDNEDMAVSKLQLEQVLQYNVPHGKGFRGLSTVLSYTYMTDKLTEENLELACILGWAIEILQTSFLIADDMMDSSETRRGRPCWYKLKGVGILAVNDGFMLENAAYLLLRQHFRKEMYYAELLSMIQDVVFKTTLGQSLDTLTSNQCDFNEYTMERYSSICKYKTSYYSFYLPVFGAIIMTGKSYAPQHLQDVENILLDIGLFFQIQDDFLDAFGDSKITGKIGTDILEGKCTWLIVTALTKASPVERKLLRTLYKEGEKESDDVKEIYNRMNLNEKFASLKDKVVGEIEDAIKFLDKSIPQQPLQHFLRLIYKRDK